MYDMYPDTMQQGEWGPGRHRDPGYATGRDASFDTGHGALSSVQAGLDLRDNGGQRPDDN